MFCKCTKRCGSSFHMGLKFGFMTCDNVGRVEMCHLEELLHVYKTRLGEICCELSYFSCHGLLAMIFLY